MKPSKWWASTAARAPSLETCGGFQPRISFLRLFCLKIHQWLDSSSRSYTFVSSPRNSVLTFPAFFQPAELADTGPHNNNNTTIYNTIYDPPLLVIFFILFFGVFYIFNPQGMWCLSPWFPTLQSDYCSTGCLPTLSQRCLCSGHACWRQWWSYFG